MIIVGQQKPNKALETLLERISQDPTVIVLTETTSNLSSPNFINCIDKTLASISDKNLSDFLPDLLLTIHSNIVSKRIKAFLRSEIKYEHWHIDEANENMDTYFHLSRVIPIEASCFFRKNGRSYQRYFV